MVVTYDSLRPLLHPSGALKKDVLRIIRVLPTIPTIGVALLPDPMSVVLKDTVACEDLHHIVVDLPPPPYKGQWIADQPSRPIAGILEGPFDPPPILGLLLNFLAFLHVSVRLALPVFSSADRRSFSVTRRSRDSSSCVCRMRKL